MIKVILDKGLSTEQIVCDICERQITNHAEAVMQWTIDQEQPEHGHSYFAHKGDCDHQLTADLTAMWGASPLRSELGEFLSNLVYNAGVKTGADLDKLLEKPGL